ncbi:hypothetical protein FRC01_010997 [Tulasnella sp. 417]|nr:hypothetical protein FRC01_010997 [Tulasnella sp. 417]
MSIPTTVLKKFGRVITVLWDFSNSAVAEGRITLTAEQIKNSLCPIGEVAKFNAFVPSSSFVTNPRRCKRLLDAGIEVIGCPARQGKLDPVDSAIIKTLEDFPQTDRDTLHLIVQTPIVLDPMCTVT